MITLLILMLMNSNPALAGDLKELNKEVCPYMVIHTPDKSVEFKPGVDVNGKPVVEANLDSGGQITMPDKVEFPLTIDMAKYLKIETPAGIEGKAEFGTISVDKQGKAYFNGHPLESDQATALRELCTKKPDAQLQKSKDFIYNQ